MSMYADMCMFERFAQFPQADFDIRSDPLIGGVAYKGIESVLQAGDGSLRSKQVM